MDLNGYEWLKPRQKRSASTGSALERLVAWYAVLRQKSIIVSQAGVDVKTTMQL